MMHARQIWRPARLGYRRCVSQRQVSGLAPRSADAPFRLAVVGSGPAGFYTAYRVMNRVPNVQVDMYEALPVPFGLVRHGVAPDHPEVKNCQDKFEEVASSPNFRFLGNVSVGSSSEPFSPDQCRVELQQLLHNYDSVLLAYGASEDKKLGIPGESTLKGIYSARQFVGWYNGLPDSAGLEPDLRGEEAVVIGQGNVALDVARMLLEDIDVLRKTDIAEHALEQLAQSKIRRVRVVGRRGPMQAAFTIKEVRELMKLPKVAFHPVNRALIPEDLKSLPRAQKRLMEVVVKGTASSPNDTPLSWSLDSCLSPRHFLANAEDATRVASTEFDITQLDSAFDPKSRVQPTGKTLILPSDVVFRSVGYKSSALRGFAEAGVQFDERRGVVDNDGLGRVTRLVSDGHAGASTQQVPGLYCAGWVKLGPTGVIASTMNDAFATGDAIVYDWLGGAAFLQSGGTAPGWDGIRGEGGTVNGDKAISWDNWRQIDKLEKEKGSAKGKEREKFTDTTQMLSVIS
ncbi:NAD(P)-binding domain protein [Cordyceps fumosorosea ARSEF 2679]|uniref:NADPH:adrenodoxin oxidoreductase, mitochondrial n=1 Tax=Cordyceps fumosorosea (strain ARSEF 2679) TaxID=1081104 RepID=A0A168AQR1_CORFA|nr:NAD(P)-binding domain protein [Cordyceps fumosorosea ARSEF 2679]OAA69066.1 NAD(P)-binding domain protein [Cordyceps fumosorosea ARSEF 2679]